MTTSAPQNEETVPPKDGGWYSRMTKRQRRWFWIGTVLAVLFCLGSVTHGSRSSEPLSAPVTTSSPAPVVPTAPAPATSQEGNPGQGSPSHVAAPVPPVDQSPVITGYGSGDYEVGKSEGEIAPGKYKTTGPDGMFKFSMWTVYSDVDRQHMIAFGSVGDGPGIMTVPKNAKLVSFSGSATWVKAS